jgi:hypothetical protein
MSLLAQSGIEHVREPDTCLLQLLADDRRVRLHIGSVDLHLRWGSKLARGTLVDAVFRIRTFSNSEGFSLMTVAKAMARASAARLVAASFGQPALLS